MRQYQDVIDSMHKLADWLEKDNGVHCHSMPRKAAYLLNQLSEENEILKIKLGTNRKDLRDWFWYFQNMFLYGMYLLKKRFYFKAKKR